MIAINKKSKQAYRVTNIIGTTITLEAEGVKKVINEVDLKRDYQIKKGDNSTSLDSNRLIETLATEIAGGKKSNNIVTIDFKPQAKKDKKKPKEKKKAGITLAEICQELKINPTAARKKLRKEIIKPEAGWIWDSEEDVNKIKRFLSK